MNQFKGEGEKCVIIAATALCIGVNFPDVCYVVNWEPALSSLHQHQEAGRVGRDGSQSHVIFIFHGH